MNIKKYIVSDNLYIVLSRLLIIKTWSNEANANKYSFVWVKAVNNYDKKLKEKITALLEEVKAVTAEEMTTMTLEEQLEQTTDSLHQEVIEQEVNKEQKKALRRQKSEKKKREKLKIHDSN